MRAERYLIVIISIGFFAHPQELEAVFSSIHKHSELVLLLDIILSQDMIGTERNTCLVFTQGKKLPSNRHNLEISLSAHLINHILQQKHLSPKSQLSTLSLLIGVLHQCIGAHMYWITCTVYHTQPSSVQSFYNSFNNSVYIFQLETHWETRNWWCLLGK